MVEKSKVESSWWLKSPELKLGIKKTRIEMSCNPFQILSDPMKQLQLIATETLANLTQFRKARNTFRRHGGIPRLVDLLDVDTSKVGFCPELFFNIINLLKVIHEGVLTTVWVQLDLSYKFVKRPWTKVGH